MPAVEVLLLLLLLATARCHAKLSANSFPDRRSFNSVIAKRNPAIAELQLQLHRASAAPRPQRDANLAKLGVLLHHG
jgi:hypothetical protein